MNERNVSLQDVIYLIENGKVTQKVEWNNDYQEYNYYINGTDIEGSELTVKLAISNKDEELSLLTVF